MPIKNLSFKSMVEIMKQNRIQGQNQRKGQEGIQYS